MRSGILAIGLMVLTGATAAAQLLGDPDAKPGDKPVPGRPGVDGKRAVDAKKTADRNAGAPQANAMFALLDVDANGEISKKELAKAVKVLKTLDSDGNGIITLAEASIGSGPVAPGGVLAPAGNDPEIAQLMSYDTDRNGRLTRNEVPPNLQLMLQGLDPDNDGITRQELAAAKAMMANQAAGGQWWSGGNNAATAGTTNAQRATSRFLNYDKNGDGQITEGELQRAEKRVMQADLNNDGSVDAGEFQAAVEKQGGKARPLAPGADPNDVRARKNLARDRNKASNQN